MNKKNKRVSLFIYPTYRCLGNCVFCFINPELRKKSNDLTLNEIKKNINYFKKKYLINDLALLGGEPFLYEDFIPLMNFLSDNYLFNSKVRNLIIATEALKCSSVIFTNYLANFFNFNPNSRSCFHISLNNFCKEDRFFNQRKIAILNLAKKKFPVRFILLFTKDNLEAIKNGADFLATIFSKYYLNLAPYSYNFIIELRLPFNPNDNKSELFVPDPDRFLETFHSISNLFFEKQIPLALRNIPLCYLEIKNLENFNEMYFIKTDVTETIIRIDKKNQLGQAKISSYSNENWSLQKECSLCFFKNKCNGVSSIYIKKFKYPLLRPFIK